MRGLGYLTACTHERTWSGLVFLIEGSEYAFKSSVYLLCIRWCLLDMTWDALKKGQLLKATSDTSIKRMRYGHDARTFPPRHCLYAVQPLLLHSTLQKDGWSWRNKFSFWVWVAKSLGQDYIQALSAAWLPLPAPVYVTECDIDQRAATYRELMFFD